ncbi:MAG: 23S rRNA (guanosine(2251)-2'-O)-methyltransferase RlmB [Flavobacteriales bacterium]|nr:MAG: 23S rRNA (guanosine(2251)-2'-O)-methyltransferase RlmB [Flavobacteriales bacterium]
MYMDKKIEIYGIRSIIEAIESSKDISRVYLLKSNSHKSSLFKSLVSLLENNNIKYSFVPKEKFKKFENKNHQGAVAILSPIKLLSIEELISVTFNKISSKTYVLLDGITDARNFGAIIRTAVASNVDGIIIPQNNSAPVNSDVIKTSSGGVFKIPIARVNNIKDAILHLNSIEMNIISLSEKANKTIYDYNFKESTAIIMGSEEKGISKGVLSLSNEILKIPIDSKIDSLNVSSAFSAVAFEIIRQRNF